MWDDDDDEGMGEDETWCRHIVYSTMLNIPI